MSRQPTQTSRPPRTAWEREPVTEDVIVRRAQALLGAAFGESVTWLEPLIALGVATVTEATDTADNLKRALAPSADQVRTTLSGMDLRCVDDAVRDLLLLLADPIPEDGDAMSVAKSQVQCSLEVRDAVELLLIGARRLLSEPFELGDEQWASLDAFETSVRPELWRLIPLNTWRAETLGWISPGRRAAFWWWSDGCDLPPDALDSLSVAAHVLLRFPGVMDYLNRMGEAQRVIDSGTSAGLQDLLSLFASIEKRNDR